MMEIKRKINIARRIDRVKTLKKVVFVLLFALLLVCCLFGFAACKPINSNSSAENSAYRSGEFSESDTKEESNASAVSADSGGEEQSGSDGQGEVQGDKYYTVIFYKEDGVTEYFSVTVTENGTFVFPDDHPLDSTKRREFLGWGIFNGESFEETPYDITVDGADIVTGHLKFKALYGDYLYTPISP